MRASAARTREPAKQRRRSLKTREAILGAAESLFGQVGFDASSTREISERSGLNKALIHYHFESKDELLAAVLDRHYDRLAETVLAAANGATGVKQRLFNVLDAYVDFLAANHNFAKIVQREVSSGRHVDKVWERSAPVFQLVVDWVSHEFPRSASGPLSAPQLLLSFYGMVVTYFVFPQVLAKGMAEDPLAPGPLAERKAHLHQMLELVLAQLGPARGETA